MNIKEIRELLQLIEESGIEELELERAGTRIRLKKATAPRPESPIQPTAATERIAELPTKAEKPSEKEELHVFRAPIVGTFYLSPKPDAEPFVRLGDHVKKEMVLCIIEAMKLFNQIESDVEGEVVAILVENGQPVEYGEPLFEIRLKS